MFKEEIVPHHDTGGPTWESQHACLFIGLRHKFLLLRPELLLGKAFLRISSGGGQLSSVSSTAAGRI